MEAAETLFAASFHDARARFLRALDAFEARTGARFVRERCLIDPERDLSIDVCELRPARPERVYIAISGIHGIEGYAGSAIQLALLSELLPRVAFEHTGILLVHALNPVGMEGMRRVNGGNVDLNRNFALEGSPLFASDSSGYSLVGPTLAPEKAYDGSFATHAGFLCSIARAVQRHGFAPLRAATLAGQYAAPAGLFYGGSAPEAETRYFQSVFSTAAERYREILLTDLHTGYGDRGRAYPLFGRADSDEMKSFTSEGLRDERGRDQSYSARGDLVGYCYDTAKRRNPNGTFNGVVLELGTRGLGTRAQLADLHTLVRENQVHHHGAKSPKVRVATLTRFRELFNPNDHAWRRQALAAALTRIEGLLASRGYLAGCGETQPARL